MSGRMSNANFFFVVVVESQLFQVNLRFIES